MSVPSPSPIHLPLSPSSTLPLRHLPALHHSSPRLPPQHTPSPSPAIFLLPFHVCSCPWIIHLSASVLLILPIWPHDLGTISYVLPLSRLTTPDRGFTNLLPKPYIFHAIQLHGHSFLLVFFLDDYTTLAVQFIKFLLALRLRTPWSARLYLILENLSSM